MPRRALALAPLALALLLASPALGQELITNGDFTSGVSALDGARSVGAFSSVRRSDDTMLAFPGTKTTALQLLPGAEVAINAATSTHLREGWYQISSSSTSAPTTRTPAAARRPRRCGSTYVTARARSSRRGSTASRSAPRVTSGCTTTSGCPSTASATRQRG